ncbi:VOC family protein [Cupriavidus campinensis]
MHFDHVTLITDDIEAMRRFFVDIAGLRVGPRPPFRVDGYWFYLDGRPVIHLVRSNFRATHSMPTPRIDHCAFRVGDPQAWQALMDRLRAAGTPFQTAVVPLSGERQIFVPLTPAVSVEFVMSVAQA